MWQGYQKLYKLVNSLTGKKDLNPMPESPSDEVLAEGFAEYFITKIDKIRENFTNTECYQPITDEPIPEFTCFNVLSESDVEKLVGFLQTKTCELDPIPTIFFKQMMPVIKPYVTKIINDSLTSGVFYDEWKISIVRPLIKKIK